MNPQRLTGRVERRICLGLSEELSPHCTALDQIQRNRWGEITPPRETHGPGQASTNADAEYLPSHEVSKANVCVCEPTTLYISPASMTFLPDSNITYDIVYDIVHDIVCDVTIVHI